MTQRVLLLVAGTADAVDETGDARLAEILGGTGLGGVAVVLPFRGPEPAPKCTPPVEGGGPADAAPLRSIRRFAKRAMRAALRMRDAIATSDVWWAFRRLGIRAVLAFGRSERQRTGEALGGAFLAPDRLAPGGVFDTASVERLVAWQAGVLSATFELPPAVLTEPALMGRLVESLAAHHEDPFHAVVVDSGPYVLLAAGYALSRLMDLPLVLVDGARRGEWTPSSQERILTEFARRRGIDVPGPVGDARFGEELAAAAWTGSRGVDFAQDRPVVTAVIEASGDARALRDSIDALRASSLPNWEAILVVGSSDPLSAERVHREVADLGDSRVRVFASPLELLDLYSDEVQHAARADYFVRIAPGFRVDRDFVSRVACATLRSDLAEGYCWIGRLSTVAGARPVVAGAPQPLQIALQDLRTRWYSLEGEYAMNWRLFRAFGGFCHSDAQVHSSHVEEIVLSESAALSGLLLDHEVPLAYKWMATLSKRMARRAASTPVAYASAPRLAADALDDSDGEVGRSDRYAGRTVLFVRHHLVSYDARLMKEASTLIAAGARVIVLGGAEEPPASLLELGLEVIALPKSDTGEGLSAIYAELAPDVIHAYDVLSFDLIKPVLTDRRPKLVYECRDLIVAPGYLADDARGFQRARERRIIGRADAVVAVSEPSAEWIRSEYGIRDVAVIVHGSTEIAREPSPVGTPVRILFQGAFRPNRGLFSLITAVRRLRGRVHLTFQGFGVMEAALREYVRQEGLESHVDFIEACGPLEVVRSAIPFDVGVICYAGSTENLRRTAPNKLIDYMSAGLALVVPELPGIRSLADESHGVFFEPGSAHDLARAIEPLIASDDTVAAHKAASLKRGCEHRWAVEQDKLIALYDDLLGTGVVRDATASSQPAAHATEEK